MGGCLPYATAQQKEPPVKRSHGAPDGRLSLDKLVEAGGIEPYA
jgi:hypothetical protein